MTGTLYGLGVGPGDPELLTLKALRLLHSCPVLAYPAPQAGESLARRIVAPHLSGERIEVPIEMALDPHSFPSDAVYAAAAAALGTHLDAGRDVATLCLGDPFLYGSFMYLFARMAERHRVVVVPGISSIMAAAAAAGSPLAARNDVLAIVPASLDDDALAAHLRGADAVALVKLGRHLGRVRALLRREGLLAQARYVEHATRPDQVVMPLANTSGESAPYFSLILVHRRDRAWR